MAAEVTFWLKKLNYSLSFKLQLTNYVKALLV